MVALHCAGIELVLMTSGAVAAGMSRLGWVSHLARCTNSRPPHLSGTDGVGAGLGVQLALHGLQTAEVLLTHD